LCNDSVYFDMMTTQCAKTCGRCNATTQAPTTTTATCVDRVNPTKGVSDCPSMANLCNDSVYFDMMTAQCPQTCGRCNAVATAAPPTSCVDLLNPRKGVSDCPTRAHLCNNNVYFNLMTTQCPRTCKRCAATLYS
ncbi:hypothetical protein PMAYCL1PPCAC_00191, partial [Pristionchus mayeri]